ncbi:MAG: MBL fold metallo-hydrolase RNA specificity domain-containing protein [Desulfovibrionales bacterium]
MKVRFLGASRTVTGSCFVIETGQARFAVDCGMHQGNREIEKRNWDTDIYDPSTLDFIIVTHAHIDHTGLLPRLVKTGFKGDVYATPPTRDLMEILLQDSAYIQEMEAFWENKKRLKRGQKQVEPLYTQENALQAISLIQTGLYNEPFEPAPGVRVNFRDAGHILGSAVIELWVQDGEDKVKLVFSGDLGRPDQLIVRDPSIVETADFLFLESTYGNRDHKNEDQSREELAEAIEYSYSRGQKVIIPAFAVERTQEVLYSLYLLSQEGKLPADMPVFVDSPLAIKATGIFSNHPEYFDRDARAILANGGDPLKFKNLRFTETAKESMTLNTLEGPAVIISASGMANAGRIKHHLSHNLWKEGASVVFVGFQAMGTPGRKIVDGADKVRLFGEDVAVRARVFTIGGFSAHAGQSQIMEWLSHFRSPAMEIFLVHGEYSAQKVLAGLIREKFDNTVHIPGFLHECILKPGEAREQPRDVERALPRIDWSYLITEADEKMVQLKERLSQARELPWVAQTELRDRMLELNKTLTTFITDVVVEQDAKDKKETKL